MSVSIGVLIGALVLLMWAAHLLVKGIADVSRYLGWQPFVVAFFVMAVGGAAPNFFVGVSSALHGVPELALGDMIGTNVVDLTLVLAAAVLFAGSLAADSRIVQSSALFTATIALLPLLLIIDGELGRGDGIALILIFFLYSRWLYGKRNLFLDMEFANGKSPVRRFREFFKGMSLIALGMAVLLGAAEGVVRSFTALSQEFRIPLALFGMLVLGVANALPELYSSIASARQRQNWIILGTLLGSVIVSATAVIGTVAVIHPIQVPDFSPFAIGRAFLIVAALFFLIFARTSKQISRAEAAVLFFLYAGFVAAELWRFPALP